MSRSGAGARLGRPVAALAACLHLAAARAAGPEDSPGPIQDNSFLIEEAYNQEPGVIQHIQLWERARGSPGAPWTYTLTEEWPVGGQRHQASVTVPYVETESGHRGLGDVALNYRIQAVGLTGGPLAVAPRLTVLLATGDEERGTGSGGTGLQGNVPASLELGRAIVLHGNLGATWTPSARDALGEEAATFSWSVGASAVWLASSRMNLLLEAAYGEEEAATGVGRAERTPGFLVSPGIRFAVDHRSGLQVVPGFAFPIGVGPSGGDSSILLYLSFEHPLSALSR